MEELSYKRSGALLERAQKVLAGGVSSEFRKYGYPHALFYARGAGSHVYDVDGNAYLDFTLSQGPLLLGHSHPRVLDSVAEYSREGQLFAGQHLREVQLAETLQRLIPSAERMRFCLDGSEAVQTALRVARAHTGRRKFLRFEGHYHGWLDNVCWGLSAPSPAAMGSRDHPEAFPWTGGIPDNTREDFILLPWNDLALVRKTLAESHDEIAAMITEPIMCNNGCIEPEPGFLAGLRELSDHYGVALIFDEVITGFRMGLGGAQQYFGVTPDLAIFAKAMASGYPISAIVGKESWMREIAESRVIHAGTMNSGNPTVAAALATIEVLESTRPHERLFAYGNKLMEGLRKAARDQGQNLLVQGPGPMLNTAFTELKKAKDYRDTLTFDKEKMRRFMAAMHNRGIRIIGRGLWYISTAHTEDEIDEAIATATDVLGELSRA